MKNLLEIRAHNDRAFFRKNIISKNELEKRVTPYLEKYNITFSSFLSEETVRRIASRKNKRRLEKAQFIVAVLLIIASIYSVGYTEKEVQQAEILAYNY